MFFTSRRRPRPTPKPRHQSRVAYGLLTRNIHRWAAHLMVFFRVPAHDAGLNHAPTSRPASSTGGLGRHLFLPIMLSFTGYLLPGTNRVLGSRSHQHGRLRAAVQHPVEAAAPGASSGPEHARRFYCCTSSVFPLVAAIFLAVHFWRIRKDGGISGPL